MCVNTFNRGPPIVLLFVLEFLGTTSIGFVHSFQPWTYWQSWTLLSSIVIGPRFEYLYKRTHTLFLRAATRFASQLSYSQMRMRSRRSPNNLTLISFVMKKTHTAIVFNSTTSLHLATVLLSRLEHLRWGDRGQPKVIRLSEHMESAWATNWKMQRCTLAGLNKANTRNNTKYTVSRDLPWTNNGRCFPLHRKSAPRRRHRSQTLPCSKK